MVGIADDINTDARSDRAVKNWPPRPAAFIFGALTAPSGYVLGFPIEWRKGYLYNLWRYAFTAGIGAFLFLIVCRSIADTGRSTGRM